MAQQITECIREGCDFPLESKGVFWCSPECKRKFLLQNYSFTQCNIWFKEDDEDFRVRQKKVMKEIQESGLSFSEFIKSLGDFKDD